MTYALVFMTSHFFELLMAMTEREIKARYKNAVLGFLWIILNPLFQMIIIGSVFSYVFKTDIPSYFLFLFISLLIWNYCSYTISKVTPAIVFELSLIEKAKFPREVIPLSLVFANLFHTLISFFLLLVVCLAINKVVLWHLLFFPLGLIWITLIIIGIGFTTSALNVKYRDVNFFVTAFIPLWFYGSPILYPLSRVPEHLKFLFLFNPLSSSLELIRWVFLGTEFPETKLLVINFLITMFLFVLGVITFSRESKFFDDWV
jgi:lipopolysaccharide transport system permease protein